MPNIVKKIVAIVTTVTCAVWLMGPGIAQGITTEELQAQIDALMSQLADLQAQLAELEGEEAVAVEGCLITSFDRNLTQGMSGDDVNCLQIVLNSDPDTQLAESGVGSPGNETSYFGPLTKAAVIKFQEKYADEVLASWGLTTGTGFVGSTTRAKLDSLLAAPAEEEEEEEEEEELPAGENVVQLAADTPAAASVAKGAQNVIFMKLNFCAASEANTVSKIVLKRGGIAQDTDISYVKLYEGSTQVGSTQAINNTTHKATFSSLNWTIPANSCKVLTVKASIAVAAQAGDTVKFLINSASDITSTVVLDGVFPISSSGMTVAGIASGALRVATTTPSGGTKIAGGTEQEVAGFKFTASSTEAVEIHSITLTEVGSSVAEDVSNIKLFYGSTQVGSTVAALDSAGKVTFDLSSSPVELLASGVKTLKVAVDIGSGVGVDDRTIAFEITDNTCVTAYGANSGGSLVIYGNHWNTANEEWPQKTAAVDIVLGSLTIEKDSTYSPSAQDYCKGTEQNDMVAFKFTAGANEGVRITQIKLQEASTTLADSDIANITLYDAETGERLVDTNGNTVPSAGMVGGYATFGSYTTGLDDPGLFDVVKSSKRIILVKADVPTGAATNDRVLGLKITNPTTYVKADGLSSENDLGTAEINGGSSNPKPAAGSEILHDIITQGTLTVQVNSGTPSAATYALGTTDYVFAKFDLVSVGEDIVVSQLNVLFSTNSDVTVTTTAAGSGDVDNVRIYDEEVSTDNLIQTDPTISSGKAEFGVNFTVAKNTTKTIVVVGNIPIGSAAAYLTAHIDTPVYLTLSGAASGQTITAAAASWSVHGKLMTKGAPTLTVKSAATPIAQTYIKNTTKAHMATFYFTANEAEDIKISTMKVLVDCSTTNATSAFAAVDEITTSAYMANVRLYDGATEIKRVVSIVTTPVNYDYVDFTGLSITVPKGQTKALDVKIDVLDSYATTVFVGFSTSTNISGSGVKSGTSATVSMANGGIAGQAMTLSASGILTVSNYVDRPISAQVVEGTTVDMGQWKFAPTYEGINLTKLVFDVNHSTAASGTSVGYAAISFGNMSTGTAQCFHYSIDDAATQTCSIATSTHSWNATALPIRINNACPNLIASVSSDILTLYASGSQQSLEISDYAAVASNTADDLKIGLKHGGTEAIGAEAGADANVLAGKVSLYDGTTKLAETGIIDNQVTFGCNTCATLVSIPYPGSKVLTLKAELTTYLSAVEGSTIYFTLGSATAAEDTDYVYGKGTDSGVALATSTIYNSAGGSGAIGALNSNTMYLYATKPTVTLSTVQPSAVIGTLKEVFRFDVDVPAYGFDITINAIRFNIASDATATWEKTFNLYKSTDLTTVIGTALSTANNTSTDTTGWLAIYPTTGNQVGTGAKVTYVLKGNTAGMNITTGNDGLTISIEDGDFYWDDGLVTNARDKVLSLPISNTLQY